VLEVGDVGLSGEVDLEVIAASNPPDVPVLLGAEIVAVVGVEDAAVTRLSDVGPDPEAEAMEPVGGVMAVGKGDVDEEDDTAGLASEADTLRENENSHT
jgi:hypothetical protein